MAVDGVEGRRATAYCGRKVASLPSALICRIDVAALATTLRGLGEDEILYIPSDATMDGAPLVSLLGAGLIAAELRRRYRLEIQVTAITGGAYIRLVTAARNGRLSSDPRAEAIIQAIEAMDQTRRTTVFAVLDHAATLNPSIRCGARASKGDQMLVAKFLKACGWQRCHRLIDGKTVIVWECR